MCFVVSCTTEFLFICLFVLKKEDFIMSEESEEKITNEIEGQKVVVL